MTAARFPRGLVQPEGAYRFGLDALLLAAFAARLAPKRGPHADREMAVAELGSGCGAALLGVALRLPLARCLGLERQAALVACARANAVALGLAERVRFCEADAAEARQESAGPQDMVLANPPWGLPGAGRPSPSRLREAALRGPDNSGDAFPVFCGAAARLLRHKGRFCCIVPAAALTRVCAALEGARLGLRRILPLAPHSGESAHRLLLMAQKGARAEPELCPPLTLHGGGKSAGAPLWTRAALGFCPWLAAEATAIPSQPSHGDTL